MSSNKKNKLSSSNPKNSPLHSFKVEEISYKNSLIEEIIELFNDIDSLIVKDTFTKLYHIKGAGFFTSQEMISRNMYLIELKDNELVPTQIFYQFLEEQTKHILEITSSKWVQEWLYSKDIPVEFGVKKSQLESNAYYIVKFEGRVVGIGQVEENKKFLKNWYNISAYLFEE
ncbi:MAG: hypothetical protein ACMXYB_00385 [Candidatus Woesearchaeota archaeon]